MGLLEGIVLILAGAAVAALAWCAKKVSDHDTNDGVLIQRVETLETDVGEIKSDVKDIKSVVDEIRGFLIGSQSVLN